MRVNWPMAKCSRRSGWGATSTVHLIHSPLISNERPSSARSELLAAAAGVSLCSHAVRPRPARPRRAHPSCTTPSGVSVQTGSIHHRSGAPWLDIANRLLARACRRAPDRARACAAPACVARGHGSHHQRPSHVQPFPRPEWRTRRIVLARVTPDPQSNAAARVPHRAAQRQHWRLERRRGRCPEAARAAAVNQRADEAPIYISSVLRGLGRWLVPARPARASFPRARRTVPIVARGSQ